MQGFKILIGKRIKGIYFKPYENELNTNAISVLSDFTYIESGGVWIETDQNDLFHIQSFLTTDLAVHYLSVAEKKLAETDFSEFKTITDLKVYHNLSISNVQLFVNKEESTNKLNNENYLESISLNFRNGQSLIFFCGEFEKNEIKNKFDLIPGYSDSVLLFMNKHIFHKYNLDKVFETIILTRDT